MGHGTDDLAPADPISAPTAAVVEVDHRAVVGLDDPLEVRFEGAVESLPRMVRAEQRAGDSALAAALSQHEMLRLRRVLPADGHAPTLLIAELASVQRQEIHRAILARVHTAP